MPLTLTLAWRECLRSNGVVIPFWPSSLAPTTGTKYLGSKSPIFPNDKFVMRRSMASCPMFAVETIGYHRLKCVWACRSDFQWKATTDNHNSFSFNVFIRCVEERHGWTLMTMKLTGPLRHGTALYHYVKIKKNTTSIVIGQCVTYTMSSPNECKTRTDDKYL